MTITLDRALVIDPDTGEILEPTSGPPAQGETKHTTGWIKLDRLVIDARYQRQLDARWVKRLTETFDEDKALRLAVARRPDGTYAVLDGQHRMQAFRENGFTAVPCLIYESKGRDWEAQMYHTLNRDRRKPQRAQLFKAALAAGSETERHIRAVVEQVGYSIDFGEGGTGGPGTIAAVATLEKVYRTAGAEITKQALTIIRDAWSGLPNETRGEIIEGVAYFLRKHVGDSWDYQRLIKQLKPQTPEAVLLSARRRMNEGARGSLAANVAVVIFHTYNAVKGKKPLPMRIDPTQPD